VILIDSTLTVATYTQVDASTRGATTGYSSATVALNHTVTAVNDAPTRLLSSVSLVSANEDSATAATISNLFNGTGSNAAYSDATDAVTGGSSAQSMAGIVVVGNASTATQGTWQYSADGSTNWTAIGTGVSTTAGLYLPASYSLRFNPSANWNGTPGQLTVRLVDSSSAAPTAGSTTVNVTTSGGTTIYSDSSNAVTLVTSITAVNDAPNFLWGAVPADQAIQQATSSIVNFSSAANTRGLATDGT